MDRFDPLTEAFCDSAKGQALLDELAARKPWRRSWRLPFWIYLTMLRRGWLTLYAVLYAFVVLQDPWMMLIALVAGIWFEWRISPKAMDLRLSDREFVHFVLGGNRFRPAGGSAETRKTLLRALYLLIAGAVVAVPLWYLAWLDVLGHCSGAPANGILCELANYGTTAFAVWFGMVMLAPVAYTSRFYPLLLPTQCPAERQDGPILRQWYRMNLSVWFDGWPLPIVGYVVVPMATFVYCIFLLMMSEWAESLADAEKLFITFFLGSYIPVFGIALSAEFKGSMIVRDFLKTEYAEARTKLLRV